MLKITVWYRWNIKKKKHEFNHFEDGHTCKEIPTPKFNTQKCWLSYDWIKYFGYLTEERKVLI